MSLKNEKRLFDMARGREIDLLRNYPKTKRDPAARAEGKTEQDRALARKFGKDFFDGDRKNGYGGFKYDPQFWTPVCPDIIRHFHLSEASSVLDVGCAKGFMLVDLLKAIPSLSVRGVDISEYAIANSHEEVRHLLEVGNARELPFGDNSFDCVISINTVHNLDRDECGHALREIQRVARNGAFVTVDAYRSSEEEERMHAWNLTAKTILSVDEWVKFFEEVGYEGDYFWFIP